MTNLSFQVEGAEPERFAAVPLLRFKLRVSQAPPAVPIHTIALRCQIRIEPTRRRYEAAEGDKMLDLFGAPDRWAQTMRAMLWTHADVVVPAFTDTTEAALSVPCTFDFNVAATKYFHALQGGEVPLTLLFSGTVFHEAEDGSLQVAQVPWDKETVYRLPVRAWKEMMEFYYPNTAWLCLRRDVFDRLYQYKSRQSIPTWEQALESILEAAESRTAP
jgi:hypothetical protein